MKESLSVSMLMDMRNRLICLAGALLGLFLLSSCAYKFGYQTRKLPGGYQRIAIPVFENVTQEVGMEVYFTNALVSEFERSGVARVIAKNKAPVSVNAQLVTVSLSPSAQVAASSDNSDLKYLPENTVVDTSYRLVVSVNVSLIRHSDRQQIWSGTFTKERVFEAAQVSVSGVNSANPLYNQVAKHQNVELLARSLMKDAHDRMTERF